MSCGVGHRCGSDPTLLWFWCRLAATAPIGPLAWEPPYATGVAQEKAKRQKKKKKKCQEIAPVLSVSKPSSLLNSVKETHVLPCMVVSFQTSPHKGIRTDTGTAHAGDTHSIPKEEQ